MINPYTRLYMVLLGLAVLAFVLTLVRKRHLQERYALLWLLAGLSLVIAPLLIHQLDQLAYALGFDYPPALLLMVAVVGLLLIIFQLSLSLSRNGESIKVLIQEVGLLRQEIELLEARLTAAEGRTGTSLQPVEGSALDEPFASATALVEGMPKTDTPS